MLLVPSCVERAAHIQLLRLRGNEHRGIRRPTLHRSSHLVCVLALVCRRLIVPFDLSTSRIFKIVNLRSGKCKS